MRGGVGGGERRPSAAEHLAHELANVAAALSARAQLAQLRAQRSTNDEVATLLGAIARDARHLARLCSRILDANVRANTPSDLGTALRECVERAVAATGRAVRLRAPSGQTWVAIDGDDLETVIDDLIVNALRYSAADTPVDVECTIDREAREAIVRVRDRGIGVAHADRDRVFQPFYRSPVARELAPGTGIGLTLVRTIVERHEGNAWVEATSSGGSTFAFRLPLVCRSGARGDAPR